VSISKKKSHVVYDKMVDKYYFILPDGSDIEIDKEQLNKINWSSLYYEMYRKMLKHRDISNLRDYIDNRCR